MSKKKSSRKTSQSDKPQPKSDEPREAPLFDRRVLEGVLHQLSPVMSGLDSKTDAAQEIMYQAFEETSPLRQVDLARQALEISDDCADAYLLLAQYAKARKEELELCELAVAAGKRAIGKEFAEYEGHFWGVLETRPYMRALEKLANCLWEAGRREEAVENCLEMLRLNPGDNQGIRYRLLLMFFYLERHAELDRLLEEYEEDSSAEWAYARALLAYRREGDSPRARKALSAAKKVNAYAPLYLGQIKPMPTVAPDFISLGGEDEAISYAATFLSAWKETSGATSWLRKTLKLSPVADRAPKAPPWTQVRQALLRLPQVDDIWEIDLREIASPEESEETVQWMVVVLNTNTEQAVHVDIIDSRPKDADVWKFLVVALLEPREEDACRPVVLRVSRKTWFRSWQKKLADIGVECQFEEYLEPIDQYFQAALPQIENARFADNAPVPTAEDWLELAALPQRPDEIWQAVVEQLPVWLPNDGEPERPWVCLVTDPVDEIVLATDIKPKESPEGMLLKGVWQAFHAEVAGEAHCPGAIHFASDQARDIFAPHLEPLGVQCVTTADMQFARQLLSELTAQLSGPRRRGAVIQSPGVTLAHVGGLFQAAADFYRARPWRQIPGDCVIRVACERICSGPWYAVVMGQSGIEQGLALYEDIQLLRTLISGEMTDEESGHRTSAISLTYGEQYDLAPEDVAAAVEHGWAVAGPEAYPCIMRVNPGMSIRTPLKWELELLEGCLRAFPAFLTGELETAVVPVPIAGDSYNLSLERLEDE